MARHTLLSEVDSLLFGDETPPPSRETVVEQMSAYLKKEFLRGVRPHSITRHMLGLYHGAPGARAWRRYISENASSARDDILDRALEQMPVSHAA